MSDIEKPFWSATNLREPKSEYVQERLEGCSWENREYIEDLLRIERYALEGASGMADGLKSQQIKSEYPRAWEEIHLELNPDKLEERRQRREERRQRREQFRERKRRKLEAAKEYWVELGGSLE